MLVISSQTHAGVTELLRLLRREVTEYRAREAELAEEEGDDLPVIALDAQAVSDAWTVERAVGAEPENVNEEDAVSFIIHGAKIEKFARRTNFDQFEFYSFYFTELFAPVTISQHLLEFFFGIEFVILNRVADRKSVV